MLSLNLDYIFNAVYRFFLVIRYFIIFKVLGISPETYLNDHRYDKLDGLRDLGYLQNSNPSGSGIGAIYLGSQTGDFNSSSATHDAIQHTNALPWFHNLHFSIQNPILSFLAEVLLMLSIFVLLVLIYSALKWYWLSIAPARDMEREKKENEKEEEVKEQLEKIEDFRERKMSEVEEEESPVEDLSKAMPAGIVGLPIDETDITDQELAEIETKEDLLMNYQMKNDFTKEANQILKIKSEKRIDKQKISQREILELEQGQANLRYRHYAVEEKSEAFKKRFQIVLGYLEGEEETLWRIGILEADNLLNDLLIEKGYVGTTVADRLSEARFQTIDLAWSAHKMRNRIAHEGSKFTLTERMAKKTIAEYRAVFEELKLVE